MGRFNFENYQVDMEMEENETIEAISTAKISEKQKHEQRRLNEKKHKKYMKKEEGVEPVVEEVVEEVKKSKRLSNEQLLEEIKGYIDVKFSELKADVDRKDEYLQKRIGQQFSGIARAIYRIMADMKR